jgi:hypothetical protein
MLTNQTKWSSLIVIETGETPMLHRLRLADTFKRLSPFAWLAFQAVRPLIEGRAYRLLQWGELSEATDAGVIFG